MKTRSPALAVVGLLALGAGAPARLGAQPVSPPTPSAQAATPSGTPDRLAAFAPLLGTWTCDGSFPSNGKRISATMRFERDLGGAALVKHHDDVAPAPYHALEVWEYDAAGDGFTATLADNFGGVRAFASSGWHAGTLLWTSAPAVQPQQQFVYVQLPGGDLRVDWQVSRDGSTYAVGDTLRCRKTG